ncbi:MAG: amidohydrolase family protein [Luteitalea sp.]|nr:amidohydrolase family protein [Luteitalea sp.]
MTPARDQHDHTACVRWRAAWILPIIEPAIRAGWLDVVDGRVVRVGHAGDEPCGVVIDDERDLGRVAVLPGLINAHTHLELSFLHDRVPPAPSLPDWVRVLMCERAVASDDPVPPIREAVRQLEAFGTAAVGDIGNTRAAVTPLIESALYAVSFHELLGFSGGDARAVVAGTRATIQTIETRGRVREALAAHAPYSTSPELFLAIVQVSREQPNARVSVHLGESAEEVEFLYTSGGSWRELLEELGMWPEGWRAPGCRPVELLDQLGWLAPTTLVAHGVQLDDEELHMLANAGATLVTCPRSNQWVGVGPPPVDRFHASGVRVAVGTDSLASAPDLNVFTELAEIRRLAPAVPAAALLRWATLNGAQALGFDELGAVQPGRVSRLLSVELPTAVDDVEECLVQGVSPDRLSWIA